MRQFLPLPENYPETRRRHWYPTLSMSVEIKALPPPGGWKWLFVRIEAGVIKNGRFDINVVICNEDKELVAISRHVALVVDGSRNNTKVAAAKL